MEENCKGVKTGGGRQKVRNTEKGRRQRNAGGRKEGKYGVRRGMGQKEVKSRRNWREGEEEER